MICPAPSRRSGLVLRVLFRRAPRAPEPGIAVPAAALTELVGAQRTGLAPGSPAVHRASLAVFRVWYLGSPRASPGYDCLTGMLDLLR